MLLKILGGLVICLGSWYLGKNISESYKTKLEIIDEYVLFIKNFKSNISFSGTNMYEFFSKYRCKYIKNFLEFLIEKKNVTEIKNYIFTNLQEERCVKIITESLIFAQTSSDKKAISDVFDEVLLQLQQYKKEFLEECFGKIKTAPKIGLIVGVFVAVLVL